MIEKLTEILRDYTGNENLIINETTVIISDLGISSFDLVSLATTIEDEFDVEIPDRAIKNFKTITDVINFIEKQQR